MSLSNDLRHRTFFSSPWAVAGLLLACCLLAYSNSFNNAFLLDDHTFLRSEHAKVYGQFSEFFTKNYTHHYSPLYLVVNIAFFAHFGDDLALMHLINIALFYTSCLLFYCLMVVMTAERTLALIAGVLHSLHPIHVFTVNYLTCSSIFIMAIFLQVSLLAFWFYVKNQRRHPVLFILSIFSFIMALLTFEGALLLPAYILIVAFFLRRETILGSVREALPFLAIAAVYLGFWLYMAGSQANLAEKIARLDLQAGTYAATLLYLVCWYAANLIVPLDIVFLKNTAPVDDHAWLYLLAGSLMALATAFLFFRFWKRGIKSFAFLWLAVGFLLVAVAAAGHADMGFVIEPHWLYFSSFGFSLFLAAYLRHWQAKLPAKAWAAIVLLLGGSLLALTQTYNTLARTEKGFCLYWLARSPGNIIASMRLGELYYYEKDYAKAAVFLSYAADRYTNKKTKSRLLHNLGHVYRASGREPLAVEKYQEAVRVNAEFAAPYLALAELHAKNARWKDAEHYYNKAIILKPEDEFPVLRLAEMHLLAGARLQAVTVLERFLELNPRHPDSSLIDHEILLLKEAL